MGKVGEDPFGHFLADTLAGAGVDIAPLRFDHRARTALAFVSLRADGEREFMFYRHPSADMLFTPDEVDQGAIDAARALHFDSISLASANPRASSLFAADRARAAGHLDHLRRQPPPAARGPTPPRPGTASWQGWPRRRWSSSATTNSSS